MKKTSTGRDIQRASFVNNLYNGLRKKTEVALEKHEKLISLAASYDAYGLEPFECIELLMIDGGITREAAESYFNMIKTSSVENSNLDEYSFQFEDQKGNVISSFEIGKTIMASCDDDAMIRAEELMQSVDEDVEVKSVSKIS